MKQVLRNRKLLYGCRITGLGHWLTGFIVALLFFAQGTPMGAASLEEPVLTTARAIHDLPKEEAAKHLPVHITASVTYYQPNERNLFVADATGAVFVYIPGAFSFPIHVGDKVQIDGVTQASFRSIVASSARVRVLGPGRQVPARPVVYKQLVSGEVDCRYVSVKGTVRSATVENHGADTVTQMQVLLPGGIVQIYVQRYKGLELNDLIDAEVEVSGVAGADFNESFQIMRPKLFVDGSENVRVLKRPAIRPASLPVTAIDRLMESRYKLDQSRRVRVRGAVTAFEPGNWLVIQNGKQNLLAFTRQTDPLQLGSIVDVVGFADGHAYSAVLEDAQFFYDGRNQKIEPVPVSYDDAMSGRFSDAFVSMRGKILSELRGEFSDAMVIVVDRHPVTVTMMKKRASLPELQPGTVVEVRGICRVTPTAWGKPLLFRLDLRTADDLRVLARPSWWTARKLALAGCCLLGLTALVLGWVAVLRRRVRHQTRQIEQSIRIERERSRLLERINSETSLEQLLEDICSSITTLVPGVRCSYSFQNAGENEQSLRRPRETISVYESALADAKGRQLGVFSVASTRSTSLSTEQLETLAKGANLMNLAMNQRLLYDELSYRSTHDQLTDLPNRRLADARIEEALATAARDGGRVGVFYIDVDKFKDVNDRYGHKVGDLFLQQIARRLRGAIRSEDLLARIGGDEFLLIAAPLGISVAGTAYEARLRKCFEDDFSLDGVCITGSASLGLAMFPDHGRSPEELKRHADAAMYEAKRGNRQGARDPFPEPGFRGQGVHEPHAVLSMDGPTSGSSSADLTIA